MRPTTSIRFVLLISTLMLPARPGSAGIAPCVGDCNGSGYVSIAELVTMVNIALGQLQVDRCKAGDRDDNGSIEVPELVTAVNNALKGCEGPTSYKHRIGHPGDPFLAFSGVEGGPSWIKFTIRVNEPTRVYFQNSNRFPFHQEFVSAELEPYIGWTPAQIDAVSLHAENQELVFGAVLYSPTSPSEIAIQLVRQDAYTLDEVTTYFNAVRAAIDSAAAVPFFYFPTFEQQESAEENRTALADRGIVLGSTTRWLSGDVCYNFGWAHGRVVFVAGEDIADAYADGTLKPTDILLTDGVPAEIPFVAGVLTLAPSTPNSHVAILAGDWEIPFAFLSQSDSVAAAQALVGREAVLRATTLFPRLSITEVDFTACQIRLVDVTGALSEEVADHLRDLKRAPDLNVRPFQLSGTYSADVATATPDDIVKIGGKAANYGFLLREIPQNARFAIAFTFDLWNDYLDQEMEGGMTLRERINELLAPFPTYPPSDFDALFDALDDARDLIDDEADFTPAQRTAIIAALEPFTETLPIRFRSSTNVEDSDVFTGAGLYESESGCLLDELDDDDEGPSLCDASRDEERGVFRALRKVFQSFYNDNAFLERLRHRVDETTVGMAVLVNHTFLDSTELANGVTTLSVSAGGSSSITIVSQPGAFSVTNPEDGGLPEVVEVFVFGSLSRFATLRQGASRLPLGATVLQMPDEYFALTDLMLEVGEAFGAFHGETDFRIEFEYKKIVGEGLDLKQVRRIPRFSPDLDTPPVLINTPMSLCTFQGERSDVFANYRLKSRWQPTFVNGPVAEDGAGPYATATHQYVVDGSIQELSGSPATWPNAEHGSFEPDIPDALGFRDSWTVGSGASARTMTLRTFVLTNAGPNRIPIVFPEDFGFELEADFETPVPHLDFDNTVATRAEDFVVLYPCSDERPVTPKHLRQQRDPAYGDVSVDIDFYWPPSPTGAVAGYTAPAERFVGTMIAGVTTQPIDLEGYFSQTYRPEHHNFSENFLFDPHLEPGIAPALLAELDAKGIRAFVLPAYSVDPELWVLTNAGALVRYDDLD